VLTFEEYADLDALQAIVGLARSGDLEIELASGPSRRVSERDVIESHHRQDRYRTAALLREVLGEQTSATQAADSQPKSTLVPPSDSGLAGSASG
jgi:hypothetical protein